MTEERRLLYIHKLLHEQAKHKQGDLKDLQSEQVEKMQKLLSLLNRYSLRKKFRRKKFPLLRKKSRKQSQKQKSQNLSLKQL